MVPSVKLVISGLGADKATERSKHVAELRLLLSQPEYFDDLDPSSWSLLVERLGALILKEKASCIAKQSSLKESGMNNLESKIALLGKDFEQVCDLGLQYDAFDSTARNALEHLVEGIWTKGGAPYKPLSLYARVIRKIVSVRKHRYCSVLYSIIGHSYPFVDRKLTFRI
jgi:hypothetical protein